MNVAQFSRSIVNVTDFYIALVEVVYDDARVLHQTFRNRKVPHNAADHTFFQSETVRRDTGMCKHQ
jgi:hypothetical protein